jgi:glucokinase
MAEKGDPTATQIMTEAGEKLGIAIASMAMILDINLYIIGGSVAKAGELLYQFRIEMYH